MILFFISWCLVYATMVKLSHLIPELRVLRNKFVNLHFVAVTICDNEHNSIEVSTELKACIPHIKSISQLEGGKIIIFLER